MKAAVVPKVNGKWELKEIPMPEPGPNQVLIQMHASGICYTDVHQTRGALPGPFPRVLGHEPVGEIVKLGAGVRTRKIGDRVGVPWVQTSCGRCEWCARGKPMFCDKAVSTGVELAGGHAEYMVAYADATALLPDGLSYEQAAPIFCAGYTVWSGLRWAQPQPDERIAVLGIGGLGHLAVQYAKATGFFTIAVSHSPGKDKLIRQLGADEIVRDGAGLARVGGADVVLSTSNSVDAMADSIKGLRPDGRLVTMGLDPKPLRISIGDLIMKRIKIVGSQQNDRQFLHEALEIAARGKVRVYAETFPLPEIGKAYERVEKGQVRFRAVIRI
jgi:alcohol dehydrogenase